MDLKTPGVYIVEKNAFPNSVVEVATAVPAFVGWTEFAMNKGKSLHGKSWRITSMADYATYFGGPPQARLHIAAKEPSGGPAFQLHRDPGRAGARQLLPQAMRHFFQNGGGACYVVSVGGFDDEVNPDALVGGIAALVKEQEPTMLVVPDAVRLSRADCATVQQAMLRHCGQDVTGRFAILDVWGGDCASADEVPGCIAAFRADLPADHRSHAAAYFPWLHTTLVQEGDPTIAPSSKPTCWPR